MEEEEMITKEQEHAIKKLNAALKQAYDCGIKIAGMDADLLYATKQAIKVCKNTYDYSDVARAVQDNLEGTGYLYSKGYEDSGGW